MILEYWDQPTRLKLHYRGPSERQGTNWHPPDFLVLRQEGASFEEWELEQELARLVKPISPPSEAIPVTLPRSRESAVTMNLLMVSPRAHGLFDKAISESGFGRLLFNPIRGNSAQAQPALG